jgi:adenylate kinase
MAKELELSDDVFLEGDMPVDMLLGMRNRSKGSPVEQQKTVKAEKPASESKAKLVFLVGIEETEKDSIVSMVLKNYKDQMPLFKYIKVDAPKLDGAELAAIQCKKNTFLQKVKKSVEASNGRNIVLSGSLIHKIEGGYVPLFSSGFIEGLKPDFFIFFFVDTESLKAVGGKLNIQDIKKRQDMNWECIKSYCISGGIPMKMIKVVHGDIKSAVSNTYRMLKSVFE